MTVNKIQGFPWTPMKFKVFHDYQINSRFYMFTHNSRCSMYNQKIQGFPLLSMKFQVYHDYRLNSRFPGRVWTQNELRWIQEKPALNLYARRGEDRDVEAWLQECLRIAGVHEPCANAASSHWATSRRVCSTLCEHFHSRLDERALSSSF